VEAEVEAPPAGISSGGGHRARGSGGVVVNGHRLRLEPSREDKAAGRNKKKTSKEKIKKKERKRKKGHY
jgi:hypothetical protein